MYLYDDDCTQTVIFNPISYIPSVYLHLYGITDTIYVYISILYIVGVSGKDQKLKMQIGENAKKMKELVLPNLFWAYKYFYLYAYRLCFVRNRGDDS